MASVGKFITLEGGEGVGKSTLISGLSRALQKQGLEVIQTREPGGSVGAEAIRELLLHPPQNEDWSELTQSLLFFAARRDHLEKTILPALANGIWVLCDRFSDSTRAYQVANGSGVSDQIEVLDEMVVGEAQPDLTLVLQMHPETALKRRKQRGGGDDAFERKDMDFHGSVHKAFDAIARVNPDRCVIVNADQPPEAVLDDAMNFINTRFCING